MQTIFIRYFTTWMLSDIRKCLPNICGSYSVELNPVHSKSGKKLRNINNKHIDTTSPTNLTDFTHDGICRPCHSDNRSRYITLLNGARKSFSCSRQQVKSLSYKMTDANNTEFKKFSFYDYDIIGFDLDNTLLRYNLNEMLPLIYQALCDYLVNVKDYPPELAEEKFDADFLQRGLVLDSDNGNILKLSNNATILRATHGTKLLTKAEIIDIYGPELQWSVSTQFFHAPLSTWNGPLSEKLRTLLDFFDTPAGLVFAKAVDLLDRQGKNSKPYKIWPDILDGLVCLYSREHFETTKSQYFNALRANPERYLMRTSENSIQWLKELRSCGKAIFLLTGSNANFANFTASYALGTNWKELFDCVVCFAKKPGFFSMHRPFLNVENWQEIPNSERSFDELLPLDTIYSQGNWKQLYKSIANRLKKSTNGARTLYVGDNLIQDVYTPVEHGDLDAVVLCEELYGDTNYAHSDYEFRNMVNSKFWGSYFCIDNQPTLWSAMIGDYSKLCVASIDELAKESILHHFISKNKHGFFPESPVDLIIKHVEV